MVMAKRQLAQLRKNPAAFDLMSESEYVAFEKHIPQQRPLTILDLGCGIGRIAAYIHCQLGDPEIHYILADTTHVSPDIRNGWNPDEEYYNDLSLTSIFAVANGIENFETFDIRKDDWFSIPDGSIDFVVSMLAVGYHYPLDLYAKILHRITGRNAVMALGIRGNLYQHMQQWGPFLVADRLPSSDPKQRIYIFRKQSHVNTQ
jgi:SAM-dependent methyltransferase